MKGNSVIDDLLVNFIGYDQNAFSRNNFREGFQLLFRVGDTRRIGWTVKNDRLCPAVDSLRQLFRLQFETIRYACFDRNRSGIVRPILSPQGEALTNGCVSKSFMLCSYPVTS